MWNKEEILVKRAPHKGSALVDYDVAKIAKAIMAASLTTPVVISQEDSDLVCNAVTYKVLMSDSNVVTVERLHALVVEALKRVRPDVAESYVNYRALSKKQAQIFESMLKRVSSTVYGGDVSNANVDSARTAALFSLTACYFGEEWFKLSFLTQEERQAIEDGYIKAHDMDKRQLYPFNCCLFDAGAVLKGGFEMSNTWYNEPKGLDTFFDVLGDLIQSAASQQYGGFTVPRIDNISAYYAEKSYQRYLAKYKKKYMALGISEDEAVAQAEKDAEAEVKEEYRQGFQGLEYKLNTVASSRGDYPFVTVTAGKDVGKWQEMATITMFEVHMGGQGKPGHKKPVLFPKLVFLYDRNLHGEGGILRKEYEAALKCSAKTMYPDWLSLTGEGYVPSMYEKYGEVVSPMGCRAFLSPWYERGGMEPADEEDRPIFEGRFNIGVFSLHLPMILQKSRMEGKPFYEVLDYYLQMIRRLHIRTRNHIAQMPAKRNPLMFCEGGCYGGNLGLNDKIGSSDKILPSATASFGITALNELQQLYNGRSIVEDGEFALEVMRYINERISDFKKEDGILYAVYGTPAENLCGLQIKQFRALYGVIEGVSDREYVSNSFHCGVWEDISPIEKQNLENRFWDLFNGGKIQYVRYPLGYNEAAISSLVDRAMEMGFYEGVNLALNFCDDCGYQQVDMEDECPCCGSKNLTKIDRMNGYLAYSRVKGSSRLNAAKMAEIAERKSM